MANHLPCRSSCILLVFCGFICSASGQRPEDREWKGSRRALFMEDQTPFGKDVWLVYTRGWLCGWTPHGMCVSPYHKRDVHDFFVIPFRYFLSGVYCDQTPKLDWGFGLNSVILARFSRSADGAYWPATVNGYWANGYGQVTSVQGKTFFHRLGTNQIKEYFPPHRIRLKGAHDACEHFRTNCRGNEYCVPRKSSAGRILPGEYWCACRGGWKYVRGRGCLDVDECVKSPCGAFQVCVNTQGGYKCTCPIGYKGAKCDEDVDECETKPCPAYSICENAIGGFNCTCKEGYSGKSCSELSGLSSHGADPILTFKVVKLHSIKRISVPREKPAIIIRKAVHIRDSGRKEMAIMGSLMFFSYALGTYLYRSQKRKRARTRKKSKEKKKQSIENVGSVSDSHVVTEGATSLRSEIETVEGTTETTENDNFSEKSTEEQSIENVGSVSDSHVVTEGATSLRSEMETVEGTTETTENDNFSETSTEEQGDIVEKHSATDSFYENGIVDIPILENKSTGKEEVLSSHSLNKGATSSSHLMGKVVSSGQLLGEDAASRSSSVEKKTIASNQSVIVPDAMVFVPSCPSQARDIIPVSQSEDKEVSGVMSQSPEKADAQSNPSMDDVVNH